MMSMEREQFAAVVTAALAEYLKHPTEAEIDAWWAVCKSLALADVQRALRAHSMDPEDGKRAPRPVDIKRRLVVPSRGQHGEPDPRAIDRDSPRMAAYREQCIRAPAVVNTAHAIALRHGNKPWWPRGGGPFQLPQREPGED